MLNGILDWKLSRGMRALMYRNDGTSVHGGSTTLVRGWLKWLGMRSLDIASQHAKALLWSAYIAVRSPISMTCGI